MTWLWINFVDGETLLGIIVTKSSDIWTALDALREIEPGGYIAYMAMDAKFGDPPAEYIDRVLGYEQASALSIAWTGKEIVNGRGELPN